MGIACIHINYAFLLMGLPLLSECTRCMAGMALHIKPSLQSSTPPSLSCLLPFFAHHTAHSFLAALLDSTSWSPRSPSFTHTLDKAAQCLTQTASPASAAATAEPATSPEQREPLALSALPHPACLRTTLWPTRASSVCSRLQLIPAILALSPSTALDCLPCREPRIRDAAMLLDLQYLHHTT